MNNFSTGSLVFATPLAVFSGFLVKPSSYCSHDLNGIILYRGQAWPLFTRVMALCQF